MFQRFNYVSALSGLINMAYQGSEQFSSSQSINVIDFLNYSTKKNLVLEGIFPRSIFDPQSLQQSGFKQKK